jgi:tetratricopeptide (TPR) repeat protein
VIAQVLALDTEKGEEMGLAEALVNVGLADIRPYGYLRFDPALALALRGELGDGAWSMAEAEWGKAMAQFTDFLCEQRTQDAQHAQTLAALDLANLVAALEVCYRTALEATTLPADSPLVAVSFDVLVETATRLEQLLAPLSRVRTLARVVRVGQCAGQRLGEWCHSRYLIESATIGRLLAAGCCSAAVDAARHLLERALQAGRSKYPEADGDLAMCQFYLGRALSMSGGAAEALAWLVNAEEHFAHLAAGCDANAARMASVCLADQADCLRDLGRLDDAARAYEKAISDGERRGDRRSVAVGKFQLGSLRLLQQRYPESLAASHDARRTFIQLGERASVASAWHQIGMVHRDCGEHAAAEDAYKQSLTIKAQSSDRAGEAATLGELGILYADIGRAEDAVSFSRQAAAIYADQRVADLAGEGRQRSNAANDLIKLGRLAEARSELLRALDCNKSFGDRAQPWMTFDILSDLERAEGNDQAAAEARQQAIAAYLAYRRAGGENQSGRPTDRHCAAVAHAINNANRSEVASLTTSPEA